QENPLVKPVLNALDADKDGKVSKAELLAGVKRFFQDSDKGKKGALDERAIADGINRIFPRPPGFGPPPGGRPGGADGPPGGFGPGNFLAGSVVKRCDANKDGKVTLDEMLTAAEALFKEADKDKNGSLDEKEIAAGLGILFPPPPGFGQPPGGRPGGRDMPPR